MLDPQCFDSPVAASSMIGQPPSECEGNLEEANEKEDEDLNFDKELKEIYGGHGLEDMIFNERMDDKQDMLMDGMPDLRLQFSIFLTTLLISPCPSAAKCAPTNGLIRSQVIF